jgi:hypothetical protein
MSAVLAASAVLAEGGLISEAEPVVAPTLARV